MGDLRNIVFIASEIAGSEEDDSLEESGAEEEEEEEEEARQRYVAVEKRKRCMGLPGA